MGALHSAPLAGLIWATVAGGFYTLARVIYGKIAHKRENELRELTDRLEQMVTESVAPKRLPTA